MGWPDFEVPFNETLDSFQGMIKAKAKFVREQYEKLQKNPNETPERLAVHCKAGIGRTGTTIACINSVITINMQMK